MAASAVLPYAGAFPWPNALATAPHTILKNNSGTVAVCGATDQPLGILSKRTQTTDEVCTIEPLIPGRIYKVIAAGAIAAYAKVWQAASGKVNDVDNNEGGFGVAMEAASGDGSIIKVMYVPEGLGQTLLVAAFDGTTGQNELRVPTNLADALSIEDTAGDLMVFTTTTGSQAITITPATTITGLLTANGGVALVDNVNLTFGTGSDITIDFDATNLVIATAVADTGAVEFGADDAGVDVVFYGDTASQSLTWDQSADDLIMTSAVRIVGAGSTVAPVIPIAAQQTLAAGGGAVTITEYYTAGASDAGGDAWTLVDGAQVGQLKKIQLITDGGGDATLTPTNLSGGTTITFADAGDYAILCWDGSNWVAIELGNDADGATAPVLA